MYPPSADPLPSHLEVMATSGILTSLVPPAPLPPSGLPVKVQTSPSQDRDSGCGSLLNILPDSGCGSLLNILPGYAVSNDEFSEHFATGSAFSSRRSSYGTFQIRIPDAPPPPPIQFFVPRFVNRPSPTIRRRESQRLNVLATTRRSRFASGSLSSSEGSLYSNDSDTPTSAATAQRQERPHGASAFADDSEHELCIVCYDTIRFSRMNAMRSCCRKNVCSDCIKGIIQTRLSEGLVQFPCPNPECDIPIGRNDVLSHLTPDEKARYERLRVSIEGDGTQKTCPHCCHITEHQLPRRTFRYREEDVKLQCEKCGIEWCFRCHSPWHDGLTCKQFVRGDKQFHKWSRDRPHGVANCQKCPTCRVYIQRSTGCDHMTCNRCDTHFCYKCGGRFVDLPLLGDHYDTASVFGCRYNYLPDEPVKRKAVRGGYFGAKMAMLTGYPVLLVTGTVVVVVVAAVALPIYGGYRLYKFKKNTNLIRRRRRRH